MIDPLEVVIAFLQRDTDLAALVGDRIASKHRYGETWTRGDASIAVRLDGGNPNLYVPLETMRLEVRCFGASAHEAMRIWRRLVELSRGTERVVVNVESGAALLHALLQDSAASTLYDNDVKMDFVMVFLRAMVSEQAV